MAAVTISQPAFKLLNTLHADNPALFQAGLDYLNRYRAVVSSVPGVSKATAHNAAAQASAAALSKIWGKRVTANPKRPIGQPGIHGLGDTTDPTATDTSSTSDATSGFFGFLSTLIPQVTQLKEQSNALNAQVALAQSGHPVVGTGTVPSTATAGALSSLGIGVGASTIEKVALVGGLLLLGIPLVKKLMAGRGRR